MTSGVEYVSAILRCQVRIKQADGGEGKRAVGQAVEDCGEPPRRARGFDAAIRRVLRGATPACSR
jgi:hypothetical protein